MPEATREPLTPGACTVNQTQWEIKYEMDYELGTLYDGLPRPVVWCFEYSAWANDFNKNNPNNCYNQSRYVCMCVSVCVCV